jgi:hypothetical protein
MKKNHPPVCTRGALCCQYRQKGWPDFTVIDCLCKCEILISAENCGLMAVSEKSELVTYDGTLKAIATFS